MTKTRIEVNQNGEFYVQIPEDIVEDLQLDDGELVEWEEVEGTAVLTFG